MCDFEADRQAKIAENRRRLSELGVDKASTQLRQAQREKRAPVKRRPSAPRVRVVPAELRRSSRSEGKPAPVYNDNMLDDDRVKGAKRRRTFDTIVVGAAEEKYTQEHLAMLGECQTPWELFVDGYDASGNRVYDKVSGQTCHQCRQKTLGKRTSCSDCQSLTGVFCGDCLYMRYGENVDEALADPAWKCPHCRDPLLCNCSQHRSRRGWAPTGALYRKSVAFGYKSVAHYLVLNHLEGSQEAAAEPSSPSAEPAAVANAADAAPAPATPPREDDAAVEVTPEAEQPEEQSRAAKRQRRIDDVLPQRKASAAVAGGGKGRKGRAAPLKVSTKSAAAKAAGKVSAAGIMAGAGKRVMALFGLPVAPETPLAGRTRSCRVN